MVKINIEKYLTQKDIDFILSEEEKAIELEEREKIEKAKEREKIKKYAEDLLNEHFEYDAQEKYTEIEELDKKNAFAEIYLGSPRNVKVKTKGKSVSRLRWYFYHLTSMDSKRRDYMRDFVNLEGNYSLFELLRMRGFNQPDVRDFFDSALMEGVRIQGDLSYIVYEKEKRYGTKGLGFKGRVKGGVRYTWPENYQTILALTEI